MSKLFPEYQKLASQVIYYDYNNTGYDFPHIAVLPQQVHKKKKNSRFQRAGCHPAAYETSKLRNNGFCRPVIASEHKGFICQIGKDHSENPGHNIADRGGKVEKIIAGQVDRIVDQGGQHTEKQITERRPIPLYKIFQLIQHRFFLPDMIVVDSIAQRRPKVQLFCRLLQNSSFRKIPIDSFAFIQYNFIDKKIRSDCNETCLF